MCVNFTTTDKMTKLTIYKLKQTANNPATTPMIATMTATMTATLWILING